MRILLCAEGTRGDVDPLLALGEVLREAGHTLRFCAPARFAEGVAARGFEFHPSGLDVTKTLEDNAAAIVGGGLRLVAAQNAMARQLLEIGFEPTVQAAAGADCILAAGIQFAAATAAELHGSVYRYIAYTPALVPSREYAPALLPNPLPRWAERAAWRAMPLLMRPVLHRINGHRRHYGLQPASDPFAYQLGRHPLLLAADAELAPAPSDSRFAIESLGALLAETEGPLPEKLERFLAAGPAPVYFGFGSMGDPDPESTTKVLLEAIDAAGCRAVVAQGWAGLGAGALPEHVMPIGEVSHTRLFSRLAAVVHHGGAGTTTRAARAGVPQLVVPHLLDQHYFARRLHALGVAPGPVRRRGLRGAKLGAALRATLENELLAERAGGLGERLRALDPLRATHRKHLLEKVLGD